MDNVISTQNYIVGEQVRLASVKNALKFQIYGYNFNNWYEPSTGKTYTDQQLTSFNTDTVNLQATWNKNEYAVRFLEHDNTTFKTQHVEYKSYAADPGMPSKAKSGYYFSDWNPSVNSKQITADFDFKPIFERYLVLNYKWDGEQNVISSFNYKKNEIPTPYKDISWIKERPYTTKTGNITLDPTDDQSNGMTKDQTIFVKFLSNQIEVKLEPNIVEYKHDVEHQISTVTTLSPHKEGVQIEQIYSTDGVNWSSTKPKFENKGTYNVWISSNAQNYIPSLIQRQFSIAGGEEQIYDVSINYQYYDNETESICSVVEYGEVLSNRSIFTTFTNNKISADDNYFKFNRIEPSWWNSVTADQAFTSIKTPITYGLSCYYDLATGGSQISILTGNYNDEVNKPESPKSGDTKIYDGKKFVFEGKWCDENTGYNRTVHTLPGKIQNNKKLYAWYTRLFDVDIVKVQGNTQSTLSTFTDRRDHSYLSASEFTYPQKEGNWKFDRLYPSPDVNNSWMISEELNKISVIYVMDQGVLTYHSNYPNI